MERRAYMQVKKKNIFMEKTKIKVNNQEDAL